MVKLIALLLSACACFGQAFTLQDTAFLGNAKPVSGSPAAWNPTNVPGAPVYAAYVGDDYTTNGDAYWPDISGNGFNLTNVGSGSTWFSTTDLNGHRALVSHKSFQESDATNAFIHLSAPLDLFAVINPTSTNYAAQQYLFACVTNPNQHIWIENGSLKFRGSLEVVSGNIVVTQKWQVYEFLFNGANSTNRINDALVKDGNTGTLDVYGLAVNARNSTSGNPGQMNIAALYIYTNVLPRDYATSNYYYLTNLYALPP